jgi:sugar lactone lactonase YvrE
MRCIFLLLFVALLSGCALPFAASPSPPPSATAAPTPSATATATVVPSLAAPLTLSEAGFALSPPQGWVSSMNASVLTLAPSQDALSLESPGDDLVLTIDATPLTTLRNQLGSAAAESPAPLFALSSTAVEAAGFAVGPTTPIQVDGSPGLVADLSAPGGAGRLAVIVADEVAVRLLGQATPAAWLAQAPLYEAVLASLRFLALPTPTPTPANLGAQPLIVDAGPPGFVLRLGGRAGPPAGRFVAARGLAVAPDGTLYLAESGRGVWVFAPDGTLLTTFGGDQLLDAYDVVRAPNGELFVADFGRNAIARFRADGVFLARWGSAGDGPAQFGLASPQRLALDAAGAVYVLDARPGPESGRVVSSVVRFSPEGDLLGRIELPADLAPTDLAVGADGAIYLADTFAGAVKLAPDGRELARFGDPAEPQALAAAALDLDAQGNLYLATYGSGVVLLAPTGVELGRGGVATAPGSLPAPGEFSLPNGIAVGPGGVVWVTDNSGEYSAVTALRLQSDQAAAATAQALVATPEATVSPTPPAENLLRQWASEASASSFYAPDYDPAGATGPPDVQGCQDSPAAWASADPNGLETLELGYRTPVFAVGLVVHQSYNPGFISQIEVLDERGGASVVYRAEPRLVEPCPLALEVDFAQTLTRIVAVRLTVDQRPGANWSEIDAVELIGVP